MKTKRVVDSEFMGRIKGYLMALDDLSGCQGEFASVATLIESNQGLLDDIKEFSTSSTMKNPQIIEQYEEKKCSLSEKLFEDLVMQKFLSGLYPPINRYELPHDVLHEYKQYVLSQLLDLIEFSFSEIGISVRDFERDIEIALVQDGVQYFIVLAIKKKSYKMLFFFYRYKDSYDKKEFKDLYDSASGHLKNLERVGSGDENKLFKNK